MKPVLLDLFCKAGGGAMGYHRAGFEVVGVDIEPQPNYPFEFFQEDAMRVLDHLVRHWSGRAEAHALDFRFDAIHASPPCQAYGSFDALNQSRGRGRSKHPQLIGPVRERLERLGVPYVIENTERAPLRNHVRLCGSSFGLGVRRHRLFEVVPMPIGVPPCSHHGHAFVGVYGDHPQSTPAQRDGYVRQPRASTIDEARSAMGIDWMTWDEVTQAIPPAYTEWLGRHLLAAVAAAA